MQNAVLPPLRPFVPAPSMAAHGASRRTLPSAFAPCGSPFHLGQPRLVHLASSRLPLSGQVQVLTPSPFGKATSGTQRPGGSQCLTGGQRRPVQVASLFRPLPGQRQVLQPSPAGYSTLGQHRSSGWGSTGCVGHLRRVQLAALLTPLQGQVQVFRPSPAG